MPESTDTLAVQPALSKEDQILAKRRKAERQAKYGRGSAASKSYIHSAKDKKIKAKLRQLEAANSAAQLNLQNSEILLQEDDGFLEPEHELERTYKVTQQEVKENASIETAKKGDFALDLEQGPYAFGYSRNGKKLLLAGRKGHVASLDDWRSGKLGFELQLGETIHDAKYLANTNMCAVAQKKYTYIYDQAGVEVHRLNQFIECTRLEVLPYHLLLAGTGQTSHLKYLDYSLGRLVAEHPTKLGPTTALCQNPSNAILHLGHQNGTVTLWSPNSTTPLARIQAHRGPTRAIAVDREGRYMVSTGQDLKMSVWDIRMFREVGNYFTRKPATSLSISDKNLVAVGWGSQTSIWRGLFDKNVKEQIKVQSPYMAHLMGGRSVERVGFCPLEDVLGITHDRGFESILVPGAGEANFDALELNPYENTKQRQEGEVKAYLNKLQPEMISLDPNFIGTLDLVSAEQRKKERDLDAKKVTIEEEVRNKARGKNSALKKHLRKKGGRNVIDEKRMRILEVREEMKGRVHKETVEELGPALGRFAKK